MLLSLLLTSPLSFITIILSLLAALTVHEAAHAWAANKFGDDTAKMMGRLTLNPLAHLDPIGSLMILIIGFGWGKPVQIDSRNLKNPIRDEILIALAGPFSNLLLSILIAILYFILKDFISRELAMLFLEVGFYNIIIMLFNIIPVPPLDGSKILRLILPPQTAFLLDKYGLFLILFIFFVPIGGHPLINLLIDQPSQIIFKLLFGQSL